MPEIREQKADDELQAAQGKVLAELLGKKTIKKKIRRLTLAQESALRYLKSGDAFEVVTQTIEFGDDKVDPVTKQVMPLARRKALVVQLLVEPEEKQWIEHLMKALQGVSLGKKEVELFRFHIRRLNYQGALRDHYEFYGMTEREREGR